MRQTWLRPSLNGLRLVGEEFPLTVDELGAVVDAALALRLEDLEVHAEVWPAVVPVLARLLSSHTLTYLRIIADEGGDALLDEPAAAMLSAALRANCTLRDLDLYNVRLWDDVSAAVALLRSLTGHASLRNLTCLHSHVGGAVDAAVIGAALGALVAADAAAFEELDLSRCNLADAGLDALCDALPHNTHLRKLDLDGVDMSAAFLAQRLLPALHANDSLRELDLHGNALLVPGAAEQAMQLVRARYEARVAAAAAAAAGGA